jgi:KDO2-lipid IV(A) lauroyltransferase
MKYTKYFIQFIFAILSYLIFKLLGPNLSSNLSGKIFELIGPFFRSEKIIHQNIKKAYPNINIAELKTTTKLMWNNYGRVFAEFMFIKDFRSGKLASNIKIEGSNILNDIKLSNKQVIFISGHFSNFELMAMHIEKSGINLSAIYRPLNNIFLNKIMEKVRKKYICKNQIKKGIGGLKKLISLKKNNFSTALMIDQRVSEGIYSEFFNERALTTTIPAHLVKKFNIPVIPVFIERTQGIKFKITISKPIEFSDHDTIEDITNKLNKILETMILKKPEDWIWSHNRWK